MILDPGGWRQPTTREEFVGLELPVLANTAPDGAVVLFWPDFEGRGPTFAVMKHGKIKFSSWLSDRGFLVERYLPRDRWPMGQTRLEAMDAAIAEEMVEYWADVLF